MFLSKKSNGASLGRPGRLGKTLRSETLERREVLSGNGFGAAVDTAPLGNCAGAGYDG